MKSIILIITSRRINEGFTLTNKEKYAGFGPLGLDPPRVYDARRVISLANSSLHKFISLHQVPEITTPSELKYMTGCSIEIFEELLELLEVQKERV